ncbi:hypothetical protein [Aureimonas sp. Leaf454]|uniref:hypothetical protein n=1 Tax=Aureimonas sp. Leaf454 TaxID=1736381 RepID=UPI0012E3BA30|nr:hypothetical protein [Aureimonas sp. Leaf454]
MDRIDSAVPSAPPVAAALGAAPVGASEEERFTVLFRAYGVLLDYDGGITAFRKLAPSAELYDDMLQAAVVWRSAWQAGGDAKKGRRQIKTWIEKRDFLCDPPERRPEKPAKAPKPKKASRAPVNDNSVSTAKLGAQPRIPRQVVTIERVEEVHLEDRSICRCVFALENGETITRDFCVEADDQAEQEAACKIFDVFADAAGVDVSESTKGLKGARFTYSEQNGTGKYEALAEAA